MTVMFDQPGIAERAMYFGRSPLWKGGPRIGRRHRAVDARGSSAEGATGTFFETFVLLANPNRSAVDRDAHVLAGHWSAGGQDEDDSGRGA